LATQLNVPDINLLSLKAVFFILLISCSVANSQITASRNNYIQIGDSLEMVYNHQLFTVSYTDTTLPVITDDGWASARDLAFVTYFYDNTKTIKKISLKQGQRGNYYFYFDGNRLRKVRLVRKGGYMNLQYYFSDVDNELTLLEIEKRKTTYPEAKEWYELLKLSRYFVANFETLL